MSLPGLKRIAELVLTHAGLLQHAAQRPLVDFPVHWNDTALVGTPQDGVASFLTQEIKAKFLKRFYGLLTRKHRGA